MERQKLVSGTKTSAERPGRQEKRQDVKESQLTTSKYLQKVCPIFLARH